MIDMSHLNDDKSNGIKMNAPRDVDLVSGAVEEIEEIGKMQISEKDTLLEQIKQKDERISQLTAMCYTLARRLRNESFADNITAVQRQQMAEMAMQSLQMTPQVWELIHKSEEAQQQSS
jgi:hypothetical protein